MMQNRITNDFITKLPDKHIFVFGSNISGRHGKGAAKTALNWGAKWGQGDGLQGKTWGIPTKDASIRRTLSINQIEPFVNQLILFAKNNPQLIFLVTQIGCGLAGMKPKQVAPLFKAAIDIKNIHLPQKFWKVLLQK